MTDQADIISGDSDRDQPVALFRRLESVMLLGDQDRRHLELMCRTVRDVETKHDIVSDDDSAAYTHLMLDGWAARYKMLPDGGRQITAFLIPGDFCDLHIGLFGRRNDGIVALTPCRVAVVGTDVIERLTTERSRITRGLWWTGLVESAILREWIVNIGRRTTTAAIAHLICEMHVRMHDIGLASDDRFELPLTQEELGDATGMTSVHVNRILQQLRARGLLDHRRKMLTIHDLDGLREIAGFDPGYLRPHGPGGVSQTV